ncbi:MAG: PilN domain-containing protein [Algisphaera sp.]
MAENMSFLPEDYLEKKIARRTNLVFVCLFSLMLVTVLLVDFVSRQQSVQIRDNLAAKNEQFEQMRQQFEEIKSLNAEKQRMQDMAGVTATLKDTVLKSNVLSELINNMPPELRLGELTLETKADKTRAAPRPKTAMERERRRRSAASNKNTRPKTVPTVVNMSLTGFAPNDVAISEYIGALNGHPLFKSVNLKFIEENRTEDEISRKFTVEFQLDPEFDVASFAPLRKDGGGLTNDPMGENLQITPDGSIHTPAEQLGVVPTP